MQRGTNAIDIGWIAILIKIDPQNIVIIARQDFRIIINRANIDNVITCIGRNRGSSSMSAVNVELVDGLP